MERLRHGVWVRCVYHNGNSYAGYLLDRTRLSFAEPYVPIELYAPWVFLPLSYEDTYPGKHAEVGVREPLKREFPLTYSGDGVFVGGYSFYSHPAMKVVYLGEGFAEPLTTKRRGKKHRMRLQETEYDATYAGE